MIWIFYIFFFVLILIPVWIAFKLFRLGPPISPIEEYNLEVKRLFDEMKSDIKYAQTLSKEEAEEFFEMRSRQMEKNIILTRIESSRRKL